MADGFTHATPVTAEPQVRSEIGAAVAYAFDGVAANVDDTLFNRTPPNGTTVAATDKLAVRVEGAWKLITYDV